MILDSIEAALTRPSKLHQRREHPRPHNAVTSAAIASNARFNSTPSMDKWYFPPGTASAILSKRSEPPEPKKIVWHCKSTASWQIRDIAADTSPSWFSPSDMNTIMGARPGACLLPSWNSSRALLNAGAKQVPPPVIFKLKRCAMSKDARVNVFRADFPNCTTEIMSRPPPCAVHMPTKSVKACVRSSHFGPCIEPDSSKQKTT
mmetsp:Transcript_139570/g.445392  ORF Transcript_139570/g.445392 Transcript_139570/m.445392 type:complete len:204 (+) Transcript_139570:331-942(+)